MRPQRAREGSWFRLDGALQSWLLPRACAVSPGRLVNPDVLHGGAQCVLFFLASHFQDVEHSQLQLLRQGCELRRATRCWGLEELLLPAEQGRMAQIFWQPPDGDTQGAGAHSRSWKATRVGGCKSLLLLLCISSLFQVSVFAWLVPIPTIQVHFPRLSPLLHAAPGFPPCTVAWSPCLCTAHQLTWPW